MSSSEENSDNESVQNEQIVTDGQRTAIRAELSNLSFEELQKLKERIGAKVYKEAIFGVKKKEDVVVPKVFKRENKNRPREVSSKKPVPMLKNEVTVKRKELRDPRFDPLCGEFNKKEFNDNYNFLSKVRMQDIKAIRAEIKQTTDPEKEVRLRRLMQRLTDKMRASKKLKNEKEKQQKEHDAIQEALTVGNKHHFLNKSERRVEALVKQYEELKSQGSARVQRHLKRRQQKVKKKSHRAPTGVS